MENKIQYAKTGGHQKIHLQPFQVDRTNLFTGRVEMHVLEDFDKPNGNYLSLAFGRTIADLSGISNLATGSRSHPLPLCVGVERRYEAEGSMAIYSYTFEGVLKFRDERYVQFDLEFTMMQEPIETHPNFAALDSAFGPYNPINREWPRVMSGSSASQGLTGGVTGALGPTTNPMYGVTNYFSPGAIYRLTFTDVDVDPDFMNDIGTIVTPPKISEAFSEFQTWVTSSTGRNWLKMSPRISQRGSSLQIQEEYMLSGPRGWDPNVYTPEALKGQAKV